MKSEGTPTQQYQICKKWHQQIKEPGNFVSIL